MCNKTFMHYIVCLQPSENRHYQTYAPIRHRENRQGPSKLRMRRFFKECPSVQSREICTSSPDTH